MRIRIVRPLPKELDGIPVGHLAFQGCYEIAAPLCDLLLVSGYAVPESDLEPSMIAEKCSAALHVAR
jgi:hypothetical protein